MATLIAVAIGLPLGIWAALSQRVYRVIMPILDFMQTMPAFVYLIPAIPFFGLGHCNADSTASSVTTPRNRWLRSTTINALWFSRRILCSAVGGPSPV